MNAADTIRRLVAGRSRIVRACGGASSITDHHRHRRRRRLAPHGVVVRHHRFPLRYDSIPPLVACYERSRGRSFSSAAAAATDASLNSGDDGDGDDDDDDGLDALPDLSPRMVRRIRAMKSRHEAVLSMLQTGGAADQSNQAAALGKELSSLSGVSSICDEARDVHAARRSLLELREEVLKDVSEGGGDGDDESSVGGEMMEEIDSDLSELNDQLPALSRRFVRSLVPILNPDDVDDLTSADAVIDVRAGTGGDEACLFASEIVAGYEAAARDGGKGWDLEVLSVSRTDLGGVKEASLVVSSRGGGGGYSGYDSGNFEDGDDDDQSEENAVEQILKRLGPYGFFQYESGVHRVQRVPVNDNKLQTSAVSVAVLPALNESQVAQALPASELRIDTMRASGAGGQHVNTTESAVRVTHVPTGIVASIQDERSQHKNKAKALKLVAARVHQHRKEESLRNRSSARSSLMGGGDRSERIRTYNFPQDRITDHRCKVSVTGVSGWLGGGTMVQLFGPHLYRMEREERIVAMEEEEEEDEEEQQSKGRKGRKGKGNNKS